MTTSLTLLQLYAETGKDFLRTLITRDEELVFHYIPESKTESVTRKHPGSPAEQKKIKRPGKVMVTVFSDMHGVLWVDVTSRGAMINAGCYQGTLTGLTEAVRRNRPRLLSQ
jgi:hypothetical protein